MLFKRKNKISQDEEDAQLQIEHEEFLNNLPADIRNAAEHTTNNRKELNASSKCGCYYCLSIFKPSEIVEWITPEDLDEFPMCPYCGIDSVFGDASGYPVTKDFLRKMNKHWFGGDGEAISTQIRSTD